jgi:hypothetical protein
VPDGGARRGPDGVPDGAGRDALRRPDEVARRGARRGQTECPTGGQTGWPVGMLDKWPDGVADEA